MSSTSNSRFFGEAVGIAKNIMEQHVREFRQLMPVARN